MASTKSTSPPAPSEPISKRTFFNNILEIVVFLGNVCGTGPFAFPVVGLIALAISYLIRFISQTSPAIFISALFLTLVYYLFVGLFRLLVYNRHLDPLLAIPGPKGHWIKGVHQIIRDSETAVPQRTWVKEFDNPNGMIAYPSLGARRILPYGSSALAYFMNSPNYIKPPRTSNFIRIMIGAGILTAEYDAHKRQRRILTPAFGVSHIRQITPHFWMKANQLAEAWKVVVENQTEEGIDVTKWMNRVTLDIIGLAGFGFDFESLQSEDQLIASTYRRLFQPDSSTRLMVLLGYLFPFFKYIPVPANLALEKARKTIRDTALSMIRLKEGQDADKEGRGHRDIVGVMIEENRKNREMGASQDALTEDEMVNQIMTFLAAGHETTSSSVTWALYLLSTYPDVQDKLRHELQSLDFDSSPDFEQVESLKYLNNVCREVLRFIPPVTMTIRQADKDDVYNGIKIPGGTPVFLAPGVNNFDTRSWGQDADKFNPDRWEVLPETVSNYSFLTFLQGTRSCIGRKFAETEMKCLLAVLIGNYAFEEVTPGRIVEKESIITVRPKGGMPLRIRRIDRN